MQSSPVKTLLKEIGEISNDNLPLVVIMGPTSSGKSALALSLAEHIPVEIISADSMQIYKGMDIGTAKPSQDERNQTPHHLIDLYDISQPLDVFKYAQMAESAICEIRKRGRIPVLAGGTGLYIRAILYGLDPLPADSKLRAQLDAEYDSPEGFEKLKVLMKKIDPEDFSRWKKHRRKLIRALEVFQLTGSSITQLQKTWDAGLKFNNVKAWRIGMDRQLLRSRIAERAEEMIEAGWVEETERLIEQGLLESPTARQAIGYPIVAEYIAGNLSVDEMMEKIINATRQYARRQDTWFRNKHPEASVLQINS